MSEDNKTLTLFEAVTDEDRKKALQNLISGKTPLSEVKTRPMRGGGEAKYVNTYYMTRQIALITSFRWSSECLEERMYPDDISTAKEVGAKIKVTIWDTQGNQYSHISWGQKDISRWAEDKFDKKGNQTAKKGDTIAIFDDFKAAYSDGIKKCLSYFGIANDIYGGKELEYFSEDNIELDTKDAYKAFGEFLGKHKILPSEACVVLEVAEFAQITDYKEAHGILQEWLKANKPKGEQLKQWQEQRKEQINGNKM